MSTQEERPVGSNNESSQPDAQNSEMESKAERKRGCPRQIVVDPEFKSLILPPTPDERAQLEANILAEGGPRDALVVWKKEGSLLDGHTRLEICEKHQLPYSRIELDLPDREACKIWILNNQLGRRNVNPEYASYLRGHQYLALKKRHGGDRRSSEASGNDSHSKIKTDEVLAERFKVSAKTIRNDAAFAKALDKITETSDDKFKMAVLHREVVVTRPQVDDLAAIDDKKKLETAIEKVLSKPKTAAKRNGNQKPASVTVVTKATISVPTDPTKLARALFDQLGLPAVREIQEAISALIGDHETNKHAEANGDTTEQTQKKKSKAA